MNIEDFKSKLITKFGKDNVRFDEFGKYGWTSIEPDDKIGIRLQPGNSGPHWIDASPVPRTQYLLATLNVNTGEARFFVPIESP
jgi:hypothetical protein